MNDEWVCTSLGDAVAIKKGRKPSEFSTTGGQAPYLIADFLRGKPASAWVDNDPNLVWATELDSLLLWDGAGAGDVFPGRAGAVASTMARLRPTMGGLTGGFFQLAAQFLMPSIKASNRGTTVPHVNPDALKALPLLVPPLTVQRRIVDLMAHLDNHLANLQTERDAADVLISGAIDSVVHSIFEESKLVPLESVLQMKPTYGVVKPGQDPVDGILLVRSGDVSLGEVSTASLRRITSDLNEEYRRSQIRRGDVLVALVGNPGAVAVAPDELEGHNIARQVGLLRCAEEVQPLFLELLLASTLGQHQLSASIKGAVQKVINLGDLAQIRLPIPELPDQQVHLDWYQAGKAWISKLNEEIAAASILRSQVLGSLLSGNTPISSTYDLIIPEVA